MPSRMIRGDDLLDSERYMTLPDDLKVCFLHLMFRADDFGLISLAPLSLRRQYIKPPSDSKLARMIQSLAGPDLIRIYEYEGARYAFIPRFGQRLDKYRTRCPMPPRELYINDEHATEKFNKYKDKFTKFAPNGGEPETNRGDLVPEVKGSRSEVEVEYEKKGSEQEGPRPAVASSSHAQFLTSRDKASGTAIAIAQLESMK